MYFKDIHKRLFNFWLIALTLLSAVSCRGSAEAGPDLPSEDNDNFRLTLSVVAPVAVDTRAGRDDDFEEDGSNAESYLDFSGGDYRVVLFDKQGNYLMEFGSSSNWTIAPQPVTGSDYQKYQMEIECKFPESVTQQKLEEIRVNGLYVMVVANCKGIDSSFDYTDKFGMTGTSTLNQLWKNTTDFNFNYQVEKNTTWLPDISSTTKRVIPMFGYATINRFVLSAGEYRGMATIPMQRALAKVEVIDNLNNNEGISIAEVTMNSYNNKGRLIPDIMENSGWANIGSQVSSSSIPDAVGQLSNLFFVKSGDSKKWIAYIPEMNFGSAAVSPDGTLPDSRPHLNVKISSTKIEAFNGAEYPVHFARYDDITLKPTIPDDSWNHILRNHIYRFSVNNVGVVTDLHLHVIPWQLDEDEVWDFTDHVTIGSNLEWEEGTYESIDENGRVVLWVERSTDKILHGTFRIKTPANGKWYVRLTPIDNAKPTSVTFVDKDGNVMTPSYGDPAVCSEISGIINDQDPVNIYIKTTEIYDETSDFKLEIFVENLGVWTNVSMVPDGVSYQYYTIVRPGNILN